MQKDKLDKKIIDSLEMQRETSMRGDSHSLPKSLNSGLHTYDFIDVSPKSSMEGEEDGARANPGHRLLLATRPEQLYAPRRPLRRSLSGWLSQIAMMATTTPTMTLRSSSTIGTLRRPEP